MTKRKSYTPGQSGSDSNKRSRYSDDHDDGAIGKFEGSFARPDPVTGMRAAFPGLDDGAKDELFYGPASDGIEYIRMVR